MTVTFDTPTTAPVTASVQAQAAAPGKSDPQTLGAFLSTFIPAIPSIFGGSASSSSTLVGSADSSPQDSASLEASPAEVVSSPTVAVAEKDKDTVVETPVYFTATKEEMDLAEANQAAEWQKAIKENLFSNAADRHNLIQTANKTSVSSKIFTVTKWLSAAAATALSIASLVGAVFLGLAFKGLIVSAAPVTLPLVGIAAGSAAALWATTSASRYLANRLA